jgi:hypothetical protein
MYPSLQLAKTMWFSRSVVAFQSNSVANIFYLLHAKRRNSKYQIYSL